VSRPKKYGFIIRKEIGSFTAEIVRCRTSRGTTVERARAGFPTYEEATAWAAAELQQYLTALEHRGEERRNCRQRKRVRRLLVEAWLDAQSYQALAQASQGNVPFAGAALGALKSRTELLWQEVAYRVLRNGAYEHVAISIANEQVGKNWTQRLEKALLGELDHADEAVTEIARNNAKRVLEAALAQGHGRSETKGGGTQGQSGAV